MQVEYKTMDIVDAASSAGNFQSLCKAVKAAGLVDTLKGQGPFTVFAPTDQAFSKLDPGTIQDLLKPENKETLSSILTYHVVQGKLTTEDVMKSSELQTVNGQSLSIKVEGDSVMINSAKVVDPDIDCSNGVIHAIDSVVLPK